MGQRITTLSSLLNFIHAELPSCPAELQKMAAYRVVRDFCDQTELWEEDTVAQDTTVGQTEFRIPSGSDAFAKRVTNVELNGSDLDAVEDYTFSEQTQKVTLTDAITATDAGTGKFIATVIRVPNMGCESMPSWILERYAEGIIAAIKATLMEMPGERWSNPQRAFQLRLMEHNARIQARVDKTKGFKAVTLKAAKRDWV